MSFLLPTVVALVSEPPFSPVTRTAVAANASSDDGFAGAASWSRQPTSVMMCPDGVPIRGQRFGSVPGWTTRAAAPTIRCWRSRRVCRVVSSWLSRAPENVRFPRNRSTNSYWISALVSGVSHRVPRHQTIRSNSPPPMPPCATSRHLCSLWSL